MRNIARIHVCTLPHDSPGNASALARINVTEQHQIAQQHTPIRAEAAEEMRPVELLGATLKNMHDVGAIEPFASRSRAVQICSCFAATLQITDFPMKPKSWSLIFAPT
jgi:hypothetical protein